MKTGGRSAKAAPATATAKAKDESDDDADADESKAASKGKSATGKGESKGRRVHLDPRGRPACGSGRTSRSPARPTPALGYYKRIVKDFADTPAAKTAKQRIKALEKP